jgi:hypothetical protein
MDILAERQPVMTGGCQCGAVRYALFAQPKASVCHCRMCQKAVGGPFAALAMVETADLAWTRGAPALFRSSSMASRGFCTACGTPLTYQGQTERTIEVTIGSLDQPDVAAPVEQAGIESRVPWLARLTDLPGAATDVKYAGVVSYQHPDHET